MAALASHEAFFVSGGTMPEEAPSYVERAADRNLFDYLLEGKFCYVLNSRQMGKSSMCVRTKTRLEHEGVRTAFVDLTKIGSRNVTPEQWYAGLTVEVGRALGLRSELLEYWKDNEQLSPMQRFFSGLREVVLEKIQSRVVVFVDEIDSTRSLPFDTDEFFAGIRECYNRRVHDPVYGRLTFCLLGVAVPSDLIRNAQTTPFNVGERVYLKDFTLEEASDLAKGLPGRESLVQRVHYWTHGHPFLTQSLCTAIKNDLAIKSDADVDRLVSRELFEPKARETNINLADVGNRVLNGYAEGDDIARFRADILSAYEKALKGKTILQDDESNRVTAVLKLSGLMRSEGKALKVRNPIYERVFGKGWIKENMPGQELRRQRRAFFVGAARTGLVAFAVIAIIAYLAFTNHALALKAEAEARENSYQAYVATMDLMPVIYEQKNISRMRKLLLAHENDPWRGLEWSYWDRMAHEAIAESGDTGPEAYQISLSPDAKEIISANGPVISFFDAQNAKLLRTLKTNYKDVATATWQPGGSRILVLCKGGGGAEIDSATGKELVKLPSDFQTVAPFPPFFEGGKTLFGGMGNSFGKLDLETGRFSPVTAPLPPSTGPPAISGNEICFVLADSTNRIQVVDGKFATLGEYHVPFQPTVTQFFHDGKHLLVGGANGEIATVNRETGKIESQIKISAPPFGRFSISSDDSLIGLFIRNRAAALVDCRNYQLTFRRWFPEANTAIVYPDKSRFATMYFNIKLYDPNQLPVTPTVEIGRGPWQGRMRRQDGKELLSCVFQPTGALKINEVGDGSLVPRPDLGTEFPKQTIAPDPNVFEVLAPHRDYCTIEDFRGHVLMKVDGSGGHASICRGGDYEAVSLDGYRIDIYNRKTSAREASITWPSRIAALLFDWQGRRLAVSEDSGGGGVIDSDGWKILWSHGIHAQSTRQARFSQDGRLLLTCGDDDRARLWDVATGAKLQEFEGHAQSVIDADLSPDGRRVVTASDDQTVRVWDAKTGLEVTTLGQTGPLPIACQLTSDGKYVVTADSTGEIKFWPITAR